MATSTLGALGPEEVPCIHPYDGNGNHHWTLNHHFPVDVFPDHHLDARHGWTSTLVQHSRRVLPNGRHTPSKGTAIATVPLIGAENDGIW